MGLSDVLICGGCGAVLACGCIFFGFWMGMKVQNMTVMPDLSGGDNYTPAVDPIDEAFDLG